MPDQLVIVAVITMVFVALAYIGYSVVDAVWLRKSRIRNRVDNIASGFEKQTPQQAVATDEPLPTIAKFISSRGFADRILLMLMRAGVKLRPSEYVAISTGAALILAILAGITLKNVVAELLGIMIGLIGPYLYVKNLQTRRLTTFNRQLPDALSLMGSAIRSGYSFSRAMQMVSDEMPAPISEEFKRVLNETNVGLPTDVALTRMESRIPSYDLELVVTAVIIQQQIGGNLAEIIDNIASTIRDRVRVEGELAALTAEGRISGVVLVAMPFFMALVISILNPKYLSTLIREPTGIMLVCGGLFLQVLGALVIKRMLAFDY